MKSAAAMAPADFVRSVRTGGSVSTSQPSRVTRTVCSNCAESAAVGGHHRPPVVEHAARRAPPRLIIGSMVIAIPARSRRPVPRAPT